MDQPIPVRSCLIVPALPRLHGYVPRSVQQLIPVIDVAEAIESSSEQPSKQLQRCLSNGLFRHRSLLRQKTSVNSASTVPRAQKSENEEDTAGAADGESLPKKRARRQGNADVVKKEEDDEEKKVTKHRVHDELGFADHADESRDWRGALVRWDTGALGVTEDVPGLLQEQRVRETVFLHTLPTGEDRGRGSSSPKSAGSLPIRERCLDQIGRLNQTVAAQQGGAASLNGSKVAARSPFLTTQTPPRLCFVGDSGPLLTDPVVQETLESWQPWWIVGATVMEPLNTSELQPMRLKFTVAHARLPHRTSSLSLGQLLTKLESSAGVVLKMKVENEDGSRVESCSVQKLVEYDAQSKNDASSRFERLPQPIRLCIRMAALTCVLQVLEKRCGAAVDLIARKGQVTQSRDQEVLNLLHWYAAAQAVPVQSGIDDLVACGVLEHGTTEASLMSPAFWAQHPQWGSLRLQVLRLGRLPSYFELTGVKPPAGLI